MGHWNVFKMPTSASFSSSVSSMTPWKEILLAPIRCRAYKEKDVLVYIGIKYYEFFHLKALHLYENW